jgi:serine protease Do
MLIRTKRPNRLWAALSLLLVASLACNLGTDPVDVRATPVPERATRTPRPTAEVEPTQQNTGPTGPLGPSNQSRDITELIAATVQIYALFQGRAGMEVGYTGSGTLITPNGMILTNAHVASPASMGMPELEPAALAIGLVQNEDEPPVFAYLADVLATDGYLDLAVIQIVASLDGARLNPQSLNLPYVPLGDSDVVRVGDRLNIFGFPGIGGETLTFTTGNVSGFTAEDQVGNRAWIKTDATIAGGNSGGLGASDRGQIIGVPTRASAGQEGGRITDCRVVQDTNGDGIIDDRDSCIPIGGFLNALRPVNLALPLIDAAERGRAYVSPYSTTPQGSASGSGQEQMGPITWYTLDRNNRIDQPVTSFPSGVTAVAAVFDYAGMTNGQIWGERWTIDGQTVYEDTYEWDQGRSGTYNTWLHNGGNPMPDGTYTVALYAGDGLPLLTASEVTVGGGGGPAPTGRGSVQISGVIYDGDTNRPIPGAAFVVLMPGVTFDAWDGSDAQVYSATRADNSGRFVLPDLLARDVPYTVAVGAQGYRTKYGDGMVWTASDPDQYEFNVALVK